MYAFRAFLACFHPDQGDRYFTSADLLHQLGRPKVRKVIPTHVLNRDETVDDDVQLPNRVRL
jgi:hypothetical protein